MVLILNRIVIQSFAWIILATFLGTIMYLFWKVVGKFVEKCGYVDINYFIWKIVILSFVIPFSFMYIKKIEKIGMYGFDFYNTKLIVFTTNFLMCIWFVIFMIKIIKFVCPYINIYQAMKMKGKTDDQIQEKVEIIAKKIGVKRNIQVVILDQIKIPMAYGVLKAKILLPNRVYREKELKYILYHELTHHKHKDLLWKLLENIIHCMYWFHPCFKDILYQIDQWRETHCDMEVSRYISSMKEYFSTIIQIAVEERNNNAYMVGLCEGAQLLVVRMQRMEIYLEKKPLRRTVTVIIGMLVITLSSVTVIASTKGFANGYEWVANKTASKEAEVIVNKKDYIEKQRKYNQNNKIVTKKEALKPGTMEPIVWDVPSQQRAQTKSFYLQKGDNINITISVETEDDHEETEVEIGMLENDQKEQYVEKGSEFDHIFKINKNGYYQLYMENKSKDKVTFAGAYSVHEKDEEE